MEIFDGYGSGGAALQVVENVTEVAARALKLAYIKLMNIGAFRLDPKAEQQILKAIHQFDSEWVYDMNTETECSIYHSPKSDYQLGGGDLYCKPNTHSNRFSPVSWLTPPDLQFASNLVRQWTPSKPTDNAADRDSDLRQAVKILDKARAV
jgi:hypothetical protein